MILAAQSLHTAFSDLLAEPSWNAEGSVTPMDYGPEAVASQSDFQAQMFEAAFGTGAPQAIRPALLLPDEATVTWRVGEAVGEIKLSSPLMSLGRRPDPSLMDRELEGVRLGDTYIFDNVTDVAGQHAVLFRVAGGKVDETLYLFDQRELYPLDIGMVDYIAMATLSRAFSRWQYLFCKRPLTPDQVKAIEAGLACLDQRLPDEDRSALRERLAARTS